MKSLGVINLVNICTYFLRELHFLEFQVDDSLFPQCLFVVDVDANNLKLILGRKAKYRTDVFFKHVEL